MGKRRIILLYPTTHAVMQAAQVLDRAQIAHEIIPRPKGIDADCGIAISVTPDDREAALAALQGVFRQPERVLEHASA